MDLTRTLRLRITFARNPACLDTGGTQEHWKVEVYEVTQGTTRYPYSVEGVLEYVWVCDKWSSREELEGDLESYWDSVRTNQQGNSVCIPAHREVIPGVRLTPTSVENFHQALKLARERALLLSGYMTMEDLVTEEQSFEGPKWNSPKKPKLKKAKPPPTGEGVDDGRQRVRALLSGHVEPLTSDEEPDWDYYFPQKA